MKIFSKALLIVAFMSASSLVADIKEMTPERYKHLKEQLHQEDVDPKYKRELLKTLMFGGAIAADGTNIDLEVVDQYAACVGEGLCSWPTGPSLDANTTSPDQIFKTVRAKIGLKNLNAEQAIEAAKETQQQWCDTIPMAPAFKKDKYQSQRAACSRLKEFYEEAARVQQNPTSEEALIYSRRIYKEQAAYSELMSRYTAAQQN
jgi:hypothetical protein